VEAEREEISMATLGRSLAGVRRIDGYPQGSVHFDLIASLLALWFIVGLFVDGWAHNHGFTDNTFFTPWHAILYSGIGAAGLFLGLTQYRNVSKGYIWARALPLGYLPSLLGVILFFVAGGFDFLWHEVFGFEASIEILLSPAHLLLALSGLLIMSGPLRAAWARRERAPGWRGLFPAILALALILSAITFFLQFTNLFTDVDLLARRFPPGDRGLYSVAGIAGILYPAVLSMGTLLFAMRRWKLPFGVVTFVLTLNAATMLVLHWRDTNAYWYILLAPIVGGLVGDFLLARYQQGGGLIWLRAFGFGTPLVQMLSYFGILLASGGVWWRIHIWLGVSLFAATAGFLLSLVAVPPPMPAMNDDGV
jgi:hypothetical protein